MITIGQISLNDVSISDGPLTFFPDPGLVQKLELSFYSDKENNDAEAVIATTSQSDLVLACVDETCMPLEEDDDGDGYVNSLTFSTPVFYGDQEIALRFFVKSLQFNSSGVAAAVYVYFRDSQGNRVSDKRALGGLLLA
ncbi:hypothetical protein [uncultured Hymenobacter sp.]|uniref:hypothetical protein n=1 Tax=uncultured Hymenobacter sp. TaxID=170016 RepID=UPI0035CB36CB